MKLLNNLFEIIESSAKDSGFSVTIKISPDHFIYKGHFPGYPVTPGVVFLQIVHELAEYHLKRKIRLVELLNCKFLKIVNPNLENVIALSVDIISKNNLLYVKAFGNNNSGVFLKLSAVYTFPGAC